MLQGCDIESTNGRACGLFPCTFCIISIWSKNQRRTTTTKTKSKTKTNKKKVVEKSGSSQLHSNGLDMLSIKSIRKDKSMKKLLSKQINCFHLPILQSIIQR